MPEIHIVAQTLLSPEALPNWAGVREVQSAVRLWGGITDDQLCMVLIALGRQNQLAATESAHSLSRAVAKAETPILSGGLHITSDDTVITVGCCCGVETWREQVRALTGQHGWLGHDPAPWVEAGDHGGVTVWADGGLGTRHRNSPRIDLPAQLMQVVERSIQNELKDFLFAVTRWATWLTDKPTATALVAKLDCDWQVSRATQKQ